jgi:hypothetical protein
VRTSHDFPVGIPDGAGTIIVEVGKRERKTKARVESVDQTKIRRIEVIDDLAAFLLALLLLLGSDEMAVGVQPAVSNDCLPPGERTLFDTDAGLQQGILE